VSTNIGDDIMKYFLFSDIHGEYDALIESLQGAGFDLENPEHFLIGLGDYFDRGSQNEFVLVFLMSMLEQGRIKLIRGNHDDMLLNFLTLNIAKAFNDLRYNGLDKTIDGLAGEKVKFPNLEGYIAAKNMVLKNYPNLIEFLKNMEEVINIDNYVLTHAGFFARNDGTLIVDNWNYTDVMIKDRSEFFDKSKIYIFGHWHAEKLNKLMNISTGNPDKFIYKNFIGIDATTNKTKKATIHVIETDTNIF
jgi:serine/threonine protein phosphatase 1